MDTKQQTIQTLIESDTAYTALLEKGDHVGLASALNAKGATQLDRKVIPASEVLQVLDVDEFAALDASKLTAIQIVLSLSQGSFTAKGIDLLKTAFPKDGTTAQALSAVSKQTASPVEVALGAGVQVQDDELGAIYKKPDQVQDEKMLFEDGAWVVETADGTRYPQDDKGNVLRDQPIDVKKGGA